MRPDGYHDIDTIMCEVDLADLIEFRRTREPGFRLTVLEGDAPPGDGNLIVRAAKAAAGPRASGGLDIRLRKRIPMEAGLGGGRAVGHGRDGCAGAAASGVGALHPQEAGLGRFTGDDAVRHRVLYVISQQQNAVSAPATRAVVSRESDERRTHDLWAPHANCRYRFRQGHSCSHR